MIAGVFRGKSLIETNILTAAGFRGRIKILPQPSKTIESLNKWDELPGD